MIFGDLRGFVCGPFLDCVVKNDRSLFYRALLWFASVARGVLILGFTARPDAVVRVGSELRR